MKSDLGRSGRPKGIEAIARVTGLSTATVSRALNERTAHLVAATTLQRVRAAASKIGYRPNLVARALKGVDMRVVGVLSSEFTSGHAPALLSALQETLRAKDYWPMLAGTPSWRSSRKPAFDALISRGVEGLVILPALLDDPIVAEILKLQIPAVVAYGVSGTPRVPSVRADDDVGMRDLVEHLVKLGHRSIACLTGPLQVHSARSRTSAFQHACNLYKEKGVDGQITEVSEFSGSAAAEGVSIIMSRRRAVTAIVATSDSLALGCLDELQRRGVAVPEMISVTGYGDVPMMDRLRCALTTVQVPAHDIGRTAGECILALLAGQKQRDVVLVPTLAIRESTTAVRGPSRHLIRRSPSRNYTR